MSNTCISFAHVGNGLIPSSACSALLDNDTLHIATVLRLGKRFASNTLVSVRQLCKKIIFADWVVKKTPVLDQGAME